MTCVLVVDDEEGIRESVGYALRREGFDVDEVEDGAQALAAVRDRSYDVVVLDVMLPGASGLDVCRELRSEGSVPILMLSARDTETDRIVGLELGADDYLTKPFSLAELVSRVRALLRRRELDRAEVPAGRRRVGGLVLDPERHVVEVDGQEQHLTLSEFRLLALLAGRPEHVFTRREIMTHLWQSEHVGDQRACDIHVSNLRRKIEPGPEPSRIVTIRGLGYKLMPV